MRKDVIFYFPFIVFMMVVLGCKDSFRTPLDEQSVSIGSPDGMFQAQATRSVSKDVGAEKNIYELLIWRKQGETTTTGVDTFIFRKRLNGFEATQNTKLDQQTVVWARNSETVSFCLGHTTLVVNVTGYADKK